MRPNSMNNYGLILDEIGLSPFLNDLMLRYVAPFSSILYPDVGGDTLDGHHGFIVRDPPPLTSSLSCQSLKVVVDEDEDDQKCFWGPW